MNVRAQWYGDQVLSAVTAANRRGLQRGAEHLHERSNAVCPLDEHTLISSSFVSVANNGKQAAVSYNTVYARRQHEELGWRHKPGRQAKYLEEPTKTEWPVIKQIVAAEIERTIGGG